MASNSPIGIFDSDIGGLSVVAEIREVFPFEDIVYFADTKNYPYGTKTREQVASYFEGDVDFLVSKGSKALICACSTASAVALPDYKNPHAKMIQGLFNRELVLEVMKSACSKNIGLIATELTVKSKGFEKLFSEVPNDFSIQSVPAGELVAAVTRNDFSDKAMMPVIEKALSHFDIKSLGALIIGCTHFYHVKKQLKKIIGNIPLVEPSKVAVTCIQTKLREQELLSSNKGGHGKVTCYVSGEMSEFRERVLSMEKAQDRKFIDEFR